MKLLHVLFLILATCFAGASQAQLASNANTARDVLKLGLYPPDMIMRHQQQLGISDAQRKRMASAVKTFQSDVAELQWSLQSEQQLLKQGLDRDSIDADVALQQVDTVLKLENDFKRAHFQLLIAIKNTLTAEQIDMIDKELSKRRAAAQRQ